MLVKCLVIWSTMSVILTSATNTTERGQSRLNPRIYGGRPVERGEFPYLVLLEIHAEKNTSYPQKRSHCSGSIPSRTTVLTAAHCDVGPITAYAGLQDSKEIPNSYQEMQMREMKSVAKPEYPIVYDIMICYVKEPWEWTEAVAPVALHLRYVSLQPSFVISCKVMGFGQIDADGESGAAHVMDQLIGSSSQCLDVHPILWFCSVWMCSFNVRNRTVCEGDSGGPAVCKTEDGFHQWGVNMAVAPGTDEKCLPTKTANVYVATASFRSWIRNNIKDLPSSAVSIHRHSVKISMYEALLNQPLGLLLSTTVVLLNLL